MSEDPNFYEEDENDDNNNNSMEDNFQPDISEKKGEENNRDENCSFEIKNKTKNSDDDEQNISMSMVKNPPPKREENKKPDKIFKDQESPSLNSSNKSDNNKEDKEPSFYGEDEEIEDSNINNKPDEDDNEDMDEDIIKYNEIIKKKKEDLKIKNIDINNIFEINELFDYDKDNPVFYLKENKQALDRYPWPLSTKQIVSIIQKENLDYNELRVKLVDIFEFKLKDAYSYVDFINVIKPEWVTNVKCSKIFMDLHKFMNGKSKKSKIEKSQDKKEPFKISQSAIPKNNQINTISEEQTLKKILEKEDKEKKEVKQYYPGKNARKAKKRRPEKGDVKLKVGFSYD